MEVGVKRIRKGKELEGGNLSGLRRGLWSDSPWWCQNHPYEVKQIPPLTPNIPTQAATCKTAASLALAQN